MKIYIMITTLLLSNSILIFSQIVQKSITGLEIPLTNIDFEKIAYKEKIDITKKNLKKAQVNCAYEKKEKGKYKLQVKKLQANKNKNAKKIDVFEQKILKSDKEIERLTKLIVKYEKDIDDLNSRNEDDYRRFTVQHEQDSNIIRNQEKVLKETIEYYESLQLDYLDTEAQIVYIDERIYTYKSIPSIDGFSANSFEIPEMSNAQVDFFKRLNFLLKKHNGLYLKIIGSCNFDQMNKKTGNLIAMKRAESFKFYLINKFKVNPNIINCDYSTKCKNCNSVTIEIRSRK